MPEIESHIKDLKNRHWNVRRSAAESLGNAGHPDAIPALIRALKDDDEGVRWRAAEALGKIGHVDAIPALVEVLKDKDWIVRRNAATSLGSIADADAAPALIEALKDKDSNVNWFVLDALTKIGEPALKELIRAHENVESEGDRKLIEGAIEIIQGRKENA